MRSIFIFLRKVKQEKIIDKLNDICENYANLQWILKKQDDPVLYIKFNEDNSILNDLEEGTKSRINSMLNGELEYIITIDISGRHHGEEELLLVLNKLLKSFQGFAMDDFTEQLWTIDEIIKGEKKENHKFFDYIGWYDETHKLI